MKNQSYDCSNNVLYNRAVHKRLGEFEMEEWEEDLNKGYLKVTEGIHSIEVFGTPEKVTNAFGTEQWVFEDAKVDGVIGKLTPPKGLLKLISQVKKENDGEYPVKFRVERKGMDLKSSFILHTELV